MKSYKKYIFRKSKNTKRYKKSRKVKKVKKIKNIKKQTKKYGGGIFSNSNKKNSNIINRANIRADIVKNKLNNLDDILENDLPEHLKWSRERHHPVFIGHPDSYFPKNWDRINHSDGTGYSVNDKAIAILKEIKENKDENGKQIIPDTQLKIWAESKKKSKEMTHLLNLINNNIV